MTQEGGVRVDKSPVGSGRDDMGKLDKLLRRVANRGADDSQAPTSICADDSEEPRLWAVLRTDPNDIDAFARLAEIVRCHAAEAVGTREPRATESPDDGDGQDDGDRQRAADDAVWALAEELAHSGRAWYPLIELARLSVHEDRDVALRRLATAADRDPTGRALATGVHMLREAGLPDEALGLGVGHWRSAEHDVDAGRQLVEAAVDAGRQADARRYLDVLIEHPSLGGNPRLRHDLEQRVRELERTRPPADPVVDLRENGAAPTGENWRRVFRRH
jgi:hypothetical protein